LPFDSLSRQSSVHRTHSLDLGDQPLDVVRGVADKSTMRSSRGFGDRRRSAPR
jgi:hypothetical protein